MSLWIDEMDNPVTHVMPPPCARIGRSCRRSWCMENRKNPVKPVSGPNISIMVCCVNVVFTSVFEGRRLRLPSINRFYLDCLTSGRGTAEDLSFSSHL